MLTPLWITPPFDAMTPLAFARQPLQGCNTLGLPAWAQVAVLADEAHLPEVCRWYRAQPEDGAPLFVLGGGSNVVVQPQPRHRVLRVALRGIRLWRETATHWFVEAAAGEPWHGFVTHCLAQGWPGLENLALIPGTVGAAPVQNIGAYGLEVGERLHSVLAWDLLAGREQALSAADCAFAYRDSVFKRAGAGRWLIVRVRFVLPKAWQPRLDYPDVRDHPALRVAPGQGMAPDVLRQAAQELARSQASLAKARQIYEAVCDIRRRKLPDPAVLGNAGSFFKNPVVPAAQAQQLRQRFPELRTYPQPDGRVKLAAGWLIEQAGWKGRRLGPVGMHERQALVLVNHGGAQASDVLALAQAVRGAVRERFGVALEQEPVILD
ncbi:UDP-N-acetylmuramate dehydrogenase [Castellaniella caeni]|uniref:UDP-N-acetylmuramate dehydrogenase n=1 Tax=Castellaniella caeni TaxID=266123 RepID=UPI00083692C4|nr:UDP-N-acetylmuramate dehydrogenase [Castellaniella caeni]